MGSTQEQMGPFGLRGLRSVPPEGQGSGLGVRESSRPQPEPPAAKLCPQRPGASGDLSQRAAINSTQRLPILPPAPLPCDAAAHRPGASITLQTRGCSISDLTARSEIVSRMRRLEDSRVYNYSFVLFFLKMFKYVNLIYYQPKSWSTWNSGRDIIGTQEIFSRFYCYVTLS